MEELFIKIIYKRKEFRGQNIVKYRKEKEEMTNESLHLKKATVNIFEE